MCWVLGVGSSLAVHFERHWIPHSTRNPLAVVTNWKNNRRLTFASLDGLNGWGARAGVHRHHNSHNTDNKKIERRLTTVCHSPLVLTRKFIPIELKNEKGRLVEMYNM
jgi:hypothetical protein